MPGLTSVVAGTGDETLGDVAQHVPVRHSLNGAGPGYTFDVVVCGPLPPNPTDLIESDRMRSIIKKAGEDYDLVVIDTPPTAVVSDAIPLIQEVSGVIVVARLGYSTRESADHLSSQLENLSAPLLGVVVNDLGRDGGAYGAYGYGYGYAGEVQTAPEVRFETNGAPAEEPVETGEQPAETGEESEPEPVGVAPEAHPSASQESAHSGNQRPAPGTGRQRSGGLIGRIGSKRSKD